MIAVNVVMLVLLELPLLAFLLAPEWTARRTGAGEGLVEPETACGQP